MTYRGRFAPSPTGSLHFGSLVAAVGSWLRARSQNGVWIVRMEDLDPPREVPGAAADILETLAAFGMESDEPVMFQSRRAFAYAAAFDRLRALDCVFACWCSRAELESGSAIHRGACIAPSDPARAPAWRLRVPDATIAFDDAGFGSQAQNLRNTVGDFVIRRVEGWHAYQLAAVVDDAEQGITEIVRGADLLDSTPRQIHLQHLLGLPTPEYLHLPLALDADGRKLSKQDRARPVDRTDPLPALRAALVFLGQRIPPASTPAAVLSTAARDFDLAALQAVARTRACTIETDCA
ncbi:MAG: tRNA glutamyl-Q(34) synthetase GluQRS [Xanthomonadaceae bacterium]|nr:tRNA glutamyl-Q(34) synthetase GluQRS [Xanthomonadaceae bacterium]